MFAFMECPRVGISRCLLGDEVRYDGTHKRAAALIDALGDQVEWVPGCPEVEIGMGTPREPIELVARADRLAPALEELLEHLLSDMGQLAEELAVDE